ncbi:MAG: hypothetical protein GQ566_02900 [Methanosarcinales archaeon]|nr:hypothetical protein [Methanosarcinales archaeon]
MVEHTDIIQRVFEKKEEILKSTQRIMDIAVDYESIYREENTKQIKNEINTILSCLAELKPYEPFSIKGGISDIMKGGKKVIIFLNFGVVNTLWLDHFCAAVNSIKIKPTKKSVKVVVGGSLGEFKLFLSREVSNFDL